MGIVRGADWDREHLIPDPKPPLPPRVHDAQAGRSRWRRARRRRRQSFRQSKARGSGEASWCRATVMVSTIAANPVGGKGPPCPPRLRKHVSIRRNRTQGHSKRLSILAHGRSHGRPPRRPVSREHLPRLARMTLDICDNLTHAGQLVRYRRRSRRANHETRRRFMLTHTGYHWSVRSSSFGQAARGLSVPFTNMR